jgi:hypothetical protein
MIENLIETIRTAVADDATAEVRAAGANACRTVLAALEPASPTLPVSQASSLPIAAIASAIRGTSPEQLADVLIAKLRALVPESEQAPAHKFHIPLVKVPAP